MEKLAKRLRVRKFSFTGSPETKKQPMRQCDLRTLVWFLN
jgi:acyl-CoA reductase-like NAD-dependent aldehyde dehydrogenase